MTTVPLTLAGERIPLAQWWQPRQQTTASPAFGGETYDEARDGARLRGQLLATYQVMADGRERTLVELAAAVRKLTGKRASEASVSARLRDLRKTKYGGHSVHHRNDGGGLWYYRLEVRS
jgi:hypothetical protein